MNAAVLHSLGEVPHFEQFTDPVPSPDEAIVRVRAASLKPVDKQRANGSHYASFRQLPAVCGIDGVGLLEDGSRVYFAGPRSAIRRDGAACSGCSHALLAPNPGVSAWMSLEWRAQLAPGQSRSRSSSGLARWWPPDEDTDVAHAPKRAVFALMRTLVWRIPRRSHECERGTQMCVRHVGVFITFGGPQVTQYYAALRSAMPPLDVLKDVFQRVLRMLGSENRGADWLWFPEKVGQALSPANPFPFSTPCLRAPSAARSSR